MPFSKACNEQGLAVRVLLHETSDGKSLTWCRHSLSNLGLGLIHTKPPSNSQVRGSARDCTARSRKTCTSSNVLAGQTQASAACLVEGDMKGHASIKNHLIVFCIITYKKEIQRKRKGLLVFSAACWK